MLRRVLRVLVLGVLVSTAGCDEEGSGKTAFDGSSIQPDSGGMTVDGPATPGDSGATPISDGGGTPPTDGSSPPPPAKDSSTPPPPKKDSGTPPPPPPPVYGKICKAASDCAGNELCVKLASDSYSKSNPPPPKGMCLKKCSNTMAACSSSAKHYHPCIGAYTWDLGSIKVCAVACEFNNKTYPCPTGTYCSRSFGSFMKICTPYK